MSKELIKKKKKIKNQNQKKKLPGVANRRSLCWEGCEEK